MYDVSGAGDDDLLPLVFHRDDFGHLGEYRVVQRLRRPEAQPLFRTDPIDESRGRIDRSHAPVVDDHDAVAETLGFFHEVGDEDDGDAVVANLLDGVPRRPPGLGVEARGEFVEHGDLW